MTMKLFERYPDIVTVEQLCQMLQIGKNTAYTLLREEKIQAFRIGRNYKIPLASVIAYLSSSR